MDMIDSIRHAKTMRERTKRKLEEQIPSGNVERELIIEILVNLSIKTQYSDDRINKLSKALSTIVSKYANSIKNGVLRVGLYSEYGVTYAGTAIERVDELLVYGDAIDGGGTEIIDEIGEIEEIEEDGVEEEE